MSDREWTATLLLIGLAGAIAFGQALLAPPSFARDLVGSFGAFAVAAVAITFIDSVGGGGDRPAGGSRP